MILPYYYLQKVPTLRGFWDLKKTVLRKISISGTVWDPLLTNAKIPQTKNRGSGI